MNTIKIRMRDAERRVRKISHRSALLSSLPSCFFLCPLLSPSFFSFLRLPFFLSGLLCTKVELFELIRRDSWHGGLSVRALAARRGARRLVREALMHADVLMALAQFAGQTVADAAITDVWEAVRGRFARLLGRGDTRKTQVAEQWLEQTHQQLTTAAGSGLEQAREAQAQRWAGRFADLLDEDPDVEAELRALVEEVAAQLPAAAVSAADHSVAAGRDMNDHRIRRRDRGRSNPRECGAAKPYRAGSGEPVAAPGAWNLAPGSVGADRGGTAIGTLEYQRRPEVASQPVRLAPRPVFLAGREGLLADLDARLAGRPGRSGPRLVALCGLGGAGKTSVAVEYAHRHLAEVAVCWQFPAEDPAVLAAEFAVLAAQLGARELVDPRDPVASVHAVLARQEAGWLMVFDNAPDRASVEPFVPPAGPGRVLITTQNQHWPPGQALDVPVLDLEVAADFLVNRTGDSDRAAARELAARAGRAAAGPGAGRRLHAGHRDHPGPLPANVPGPASRPASTRRSRRASGGRGRHAGAGLVPAGRRGPAAAGLMRLARVPGTRAGPAGPAARR